MNMIRRIDRHAGLVGQMAETVRVDLGDALAFGALSGEEVRGAVLRCMACESNEICSHWLDAHAETGADAAPDYCRNRALLERLQA